MADRMNDSPGYDGLAAETDAEKRIRLAWEAKRIEDARASVQAGRTVSQEAVEAWIESWDASDELPQPRAQT